MDPLSKYRQSFNSSSGKNPNKGGGQYNGFQQYIQHSIKNEKQLIQQAYQKLNNHSKVPQKQNKAKGAMNHSFYNNTTSNDHLPQVSIHDERVDSSIDNFIELHMHQYQGGGGGSAKRTSVPGYMHSQASNPYIERGSQRAKHNINSVQRASGQVSLIVGPSP